ncbi:MAG: hypothetical protein ACK4TG_03585 [Thermaurantiacus sp.]
MSEPPKAGGGLPKIAYAAQTLGRIGVAPGMKALRSRNACKACGLGMGGQQGGMVNEQGEYPSVCNKSIQAQSTDIRAAIPDAVLNRPISQLQALTSRALEHLDTSKNCWRMRG